MTLHRIVVVGGGVTGLVAARELAKDDSIEVVLLEASDRLGGQLHTVEVDGAHVDVGAEAIHLGAPHVAALVRELGLDATVVAAAPGASVLATRHGLRPLPAGVGPTGPTRILPVLRSGILTTRGLLRAGLEPLAARQRMDGDISVGAFTTRRFGREVTDTFVDPLLGNLHGGDVHQLSLLATAPQLVPDAREGRSLLAKNLRRNKKPAPVRPASTLPMFASWPEGLQAFPQALAQQSRATIRTGAEVAALHRHDDGWQVELADGERLEADHVLLTTPAQVTAALLEPLCPQASRALRWVTPVSVATVLLGWRPEDVRGNAVLEGHNGILLGHRFARTFKAATNLSRKWPGLGSRHHLLRASVGRVTNTLADDLSDEQMTNRVAAEVAELTGLTATAELRQVYRWPLTMPQLRPGHRDRIAAAREGLAALGGLSMAGAGVDGLGIGSTVRSGLDAARHISTTITTITGAGDDAPTPL